MRTRITYRRCKGGYIASGIGPVPQKLCSRCLKPRDRPAQSYCAECRRLADREWRDRQREAKGPR